MRLIFTFLLMITFSWSQAQTILYSENFETNSLPDSVVYTGTGLYGKSSTLYSQGLRSDSMRINAAGDSVVMTTQAFSTSGNSFVMLHFDQICKIEFYDEAYIEVSSNNGATWTRLTGAQYQGLSQFATQGNKFTAAAYSTDWAPGVYAAPSNAWWKSETFDISLLVGNAANAKIRFVLRDAQPGNTLPDNYAWFIDNIRVMGAFSELNPPVITMIPPIIQDTVYSTGPYLVKARITDASLVDTAYVKYWVNTGSPVTLGMTRLTNDTFQAFIPFFGFGKNIHYYVEAVDGSAAHNIATGTTYHFYCKFSTGGTYTLGTGTTVNGSQAYPTPYGNYWYGSKEQYLILASEMTALGMPGGPISSIAFNVSALNAVPPLTGFYIKMAHTTLATLGTSFITSGLMSNYTTTSYMPVVGWNTHTFQTPFVWNGVDNIIIEVCFNNTGYVINGCAGVFASTTPFNSVASAHADAATVCSAPGTPTNYTTRPNMKIEIQGVSSLTLDAGVGQIVYPTGGVIANTPFDVKVKVKNYGTDTLTTATVNWRLDGVLQTPFPWTGSLLKDSSSTDIILGNITLANGYHTIVAWTDNPNGQPDLNTGNDSSKINFMACASLLSGNYTIGGTGADFPTFAGAVTALEQCGISGPVTFNVAPGTYTEQVVIPWISGVSAANTITFQSATPDSTLVTLTFNAASTASNFLLKLAGAEHIIFKNVKFVPISTTFATAVQFTNGAKNNTLQGNLLVGKNGTTDDLILIRSEVATNTGNLVKGNRLENASIGMYFKGQSSTVKLENLHLLDNVLEGFTNTGIKLEFVKATTVEANKITSAVANTGTKNGIQVLYGQDTVKLIRNQIVLSNSTNTNGIYLENCTSAVNLEGLIANNFISILNGTNLTYGMRILTSSRWMILFNSLNITGTSNYDTRGVNTTTACNNIQVLNNNIQSNKYPTFYEGTSCSRSNYNNLYSTGNLYGFYTTSAQNYTTLAAYITAAQKDTNSVSVNPYFPSATDLHTNYGVLNGIALPFPQVATDIDLEPRHITNPDIGADEFTPSGYDAALLAILSPVSKCGLDSAVQVKIRIRNVGAVAISGNFTGSFMLNNHPVVTEAIPNTIQPSDTLDFTFNTTVNLDATPFGYDTAFQFIAWINLLNDIIPNNDTIQTVITSGFAPPLPVVSDTTIGFGQSVLLSALSNSDVYWWSSQSAVTELAKGLNYTTPLLFGTTTYWVSARASTGIDTAIVGTGTLTSMNIPIEPYFGYTYSQVIYKASYLNNKAGYVTGIAYYISTTNGWSVPDATKIWCGMTTKTSFSSTTDWIPLSVMTQVFDGSFTAPAGGGWIYFNFTTPFYYDGVSNLVIAVDENTPGYHASTDEFYCSLMDNDVKSIYYYADATNPDPAAPPTGSIRAESPNTRVIIDGAGCFSDRVPLTVTIGSLPPYDLAITSINTPVTGFDLTSAEPVNISMTNFGTQPISNFPVGYMLNGVTVVVDTITAVLAPGNSMNHTFSLPANLSTYQVHQLKAFGMLANDTMLLNDTAFKSVENKMIVYCTSTATYTGDDDISSVVFAGINNVQAPPYSAMYTDYTTTVPPGLIAPGATYPISVGIDFSSTYYYSGYVEVFIDYNRDGVFSEPGEVAFGGSYTANPQVVSGFVTVPANATPGFTRMRVVAVESATAATVMPCGTYSWGETEDYLINIAPNIAQDAGVIQILGIPAISNEGQSYPLELVVKNFGTGTITSVDLEYKVNNGTPVISTHTVAIASQDTDTIAVNPLISPAGQSVICAKTVLSGDSNAFNDQTCFNFFGTPLYDAQSVKIVGLADGCNIGMDTISFWVKNLGVNAINSPSASTITMNYRTKPSATVVSQPFTAVLNAGDSTLFTFTTLADFTSTTANDTFKVAVWVDLLGDNVKYNDTAKFTVISYLIPPSPIVSNVTSPYASPATLTASSPTNSPIVWYTVPSGGSPVYIGTSFTTPILYSDTTYYVESSTLTQVAGNFLSPNGFTGGNSCGGGFMVDVTALTSDITINALDLNLMTAGVQNVVFFYRVGTWVGNAANQSAWIPWGTYSVNCPGTNQATNMPITPLTIPQGATYAIYWQANSAYASIGANTTYSNGDISVMSGMAHCTAWDGCCSPRGWNGRIYYTKGGFGCSSARLPVLVTVSAPAAADVGVSQIINPVTGVNLTANETVTVKVKNYGTAPQSNIPVSFKVDALPPVTETIPGPVANGDSITFSFLAKANLGIAGTTYQIKAYTGLAADNTHLNDTAWKTVQNLIPNYCPSAATSTADDDISSVVFAGINNVQAGPYTAMYTNYTATVPPGLISPGMTYPISIGIDFSTTNYYSGYVEAYIDYNRDGLLTEPDEIIFGGAYTNSPQIVSGTVTVPVNALSGNTLLRIVARESATAATVTPCGTYSWGETEDYMITISPQGACDAGVTMIVEPTGTTQAGSVLPVKVKVMNFGSDTIAQGALSISMTVNGGTPQIIPYTGTLALPPMGIDTAVVLPSVTAVMGYNTICIKTILACDTIAFNDEKCVNVFGVYSTTAPYFDDFEGQNLWYKPDNATNWQYGTPASTIINSAHSGTKAWKTNLTGNYSDNANEYLHSPIFDFTGLGGTDTITLSFYHWMDVQTGDYGRVQYSIDGGVNWANLGFSGDPLGTNWYNTQSGGVHYFSLPNTGWQYSAYQLVPNLFNIYTDVRFRFNFVSNTSGNANGWAIDNFKLALPQVPNDVGISMINYPMVDTAMGSVVNPTVTLNNYGTNSQVMIPIVIKVNGNVVATEIWSGTLAPLSNTSYTFLQSFTVPSSAYSLCIETQLVGDPYPSNDGTCRNFTPLPAYHDVGALLILEPLPDSIGQICFYESATHQWYQYTVKVRLQNFGQSAQTSIPLKYSFFNGGPLQTETWTGNLAPGATVDVNLTNKFLPNLGAQQLCVETNLAGDLMATNNKACKSYIGVTCIGIDDPAADGFVVGQNVPNPVSGNTLIPFRIPESGEVQIVITDLPGKIIYREMQTRPAGEHTYELDANHLSQGVYYYTLEYKGQRITRKMVVRK